MENEMHKFQKCVVEFLGMHCKLHRYIYRLDLPEFAQYSDVEKWRLQKRDRERESVLHFWHGIIIIICNHTP